MKQLILLSTAFVIFLSSCHFTTGSGNIVTETRQAANFTGINVSNGFEVEVKIGPAAEVRIEADDNIMSHIKTEVSGNTLTIRIEDNHGINDAHLKAYITLPVLSSINASGGANVKVQDVVKGNGKLNFNTSGGAEIEAEVEAPEVEAEASGGSTVKLSGKTKNYRAEASGGAGVNSSDLLSETTDATASSGAHTNVYASVSLKAEASSGGSVNYSGAGAVNKNESSGGSVNKKD